MKVVIESIGEIQSFGDNGFTKREWVGIDNSNPTYPTPIKFELIKDKCSLLDPFTAGQEVEISYNITGRRWTNAQGKEIIFNGFQVWKLEGVTGGTGDMHPQRDANDATAADGDPDDLPF